MNSTKLQLDQTYVIDGVTATGEEIREALIDSKIVRDKVPELLGGK